MTIGEAKEIVRRYQISRRGFSDFSVSQRELDDALDLIGSGSFLSDNRKDHPDAQIIYCDRRINRTIEDCRRDMEIENILKRQVAMDILEMLLESDVIKFTYKHDETPDPVTRTVNYFMEGKLIVIKK